MSVPQLCRRYRVVFVCASWGLRATDRVISSSQVQMTQVASHRPPIRHGAACAVNGPAGPPRSPEQRIAAPRRMGGGRITLRFDLQRGLELCQLTRGPTDAPVLPLLAFHGAASALRAHAIWRRGGFPGTPTGLGLSPGLFAPARRYLPVVGLRTPATAATFTGPGNWYTCVWTFPAFTPRSPLSGLAARPTPRDTVKKDD
jgi:hypothetical protein